MAGDDQGWARADCARWFVYHDDVDEAARALEPGDELPLGKSDGLNLVAALSRRGLAARYELGHVRVAQAQGAREGRTDIVTSEGRKPPARARTTPAAASKRARGG
jgi:hypothetical protein